MKIFNRWGAPLFETDDINKGWDGKFNGRKSDPAVFDYYIEATCINNDTFKHKGNITLLR